MISEGDRPLRVVVVNKSDSTGGAAVVSRRLMYALRSIGVDARMLVAEKLTDSPYVEVCAPPFKIKKEFLLERGKIFLANGFDRSTLFKIDTGEEGLPLWQHHLVEEADAVLINWINQGMLSLKGISKILKRGVPVIWTMHDMWCMTGLCHHAGTCTRYHGKCGDCPLLGSRKSAGDLSAKVWQDKRNLYTSGMASNLRFVAVSNWLRDRCGESALLKSHKVEVIPNPFPIEETSLHRMEGDKDEVRILFGAARLDDAVKGFPTLIELTRTLRDRYRAIASRLHLVTFGNIKDTTLLDSLAIRHTHLGMIYGEEKIRKLYQDSHILVSCSSYETLPGTLVEAQAYGCIPVSFDQGGQRDIIQHKSTGWLSKYNGDATLGAASLAEGVAWAISQIDEVSAHNAIIDKMRRNVEESFEAGIIASRYLQLIDSMIS